MDLKAAIFNYKATLGPNALICHYSRQTEAGLGSYSLCAALLLLLCVAAEVVFRGMTGIVGNFGKESSIAAAAWRSRQGPSRHPTGQRRTTQLESAASGTSWPPGIR